jgi:hypothetical protein
MNPWKQPNTAVEVGKGMFQAGNGHAAANDVRLIGSLEWDADRALSTDGQGTKSLEIHT